MAERQRKKRRTTRNQVGIMGMYAAWSVAGGIDRLKKDVKELGPARSGRSARSKRKK